MPCWATCTTRRLGWRRGLDWVLILLTVRNGPYWSLRRCSMKCTRRQRTRCREQTASSRLKASSGGTTTGNHLWRRWWRSRERGQWSFFPWPDDHGDDCEQGPRLSTILAKLGRRPFQPTIYTVSVAQVSHKHIIDVFGDDGEIKTLMTANEVNIGNRDADLLKNGFIIKGVLLQEGCTPVATFSSHFVLAELKISGQLFQADRVMAGAGVRRRQRFLRSMWRHAQTAIKMAVATCVHLRASRFTSTKSRCFFKTKDSRLAFFGITILMLTLIQVSFDLVASDHDFMGLALACVNDVEKALVILAVAEYILRILHCSGEQLCYRFCSPLFNFPHETRAITYCWNDRGWCQKQHVAQFCRE